MVVRSGRHHKEVVTETREVVVAIEVVVDPVPVELHLAIVPDEIRHVAVAIVIDENCAARLPRHCPLIR